MQTLSQHSPTIPINTSKIVKRTVFAFMAYVDHGHIKDLNQRVMNAWLQTTRS